MQMARLVCVGLSHQHAPVAIREQLSQWPVSDLRTPAIEELVILSTCNRLEIYAYLAEDWDAEKWGPEEGVAAYPHAFTRPLVDLIAATQALPPKEFVDHLYHLQGEGAVEHLCRVAAGLESLVMGEGQILGQVRAALQQAYALKTVGPALALLFRTAISAGKRARTETNINTNAVSVSSAAVALAAQVAGDLRQQQIVVIGLGDMGRLALKGLSARGVTQLTLLNRSFHKAETLAKTYQGQARQLHEIAQVLCEADVVFTATSAQQPLLTPALLEMVMNQRSANRQPDRRLTLIDLAVPRNIDPAVAAFPGITLYDVDDLRAAVDEALTARRAAVPQVEMIIDELLVMWRAQWQQLRIRPVVVGLRQQAERTRQRLLARTLHYLAAAQGTVDELTTAQLDYLSRALVNQLLHTPTAKLKENTTSPNGTAYAALVCDLFDLDIPIPTAEQVARFAADKETSETVDDFAFDLRWAFTPTDEPTAVAPQPDRETPHGQQQEIMWQYELVGQP